MIPGHVKIMMNLSPARCKILKIPSPLINDKLTPILSFFFCRRAESVEEARLTLHGWRRALRELGPEKKGSSEFLSLSQSVTRALRRI